MTKAPRENRFEGRGRTVFAVFYSLLGLVLLGAALFAVKIVRDEVKRGYERSIILREPRVSSDLSQSPPRGLLQVADGLEDKPYRLRTDDNGFILPSRVHESPDISIVFLGGSTTECHFMDEKERFPYLVGRNLEAAIGKKVNAYNTGHAGNNTLHCDLILQAKVLPMRPQFAVLMECINDLTFMAMLGDYWSQNATRGIIQDKEYNFAKRWIIDNLIGHKQSKVDAKDEFAGQRTMARNVVPERMSKEYKKNLDLFVFLCRQHDITPVLMTQCNRFTPKLAENLERQIQPIFQSWGLSYEQYKVCYDTLNETVRKVAAEQGVLLIDLDRMVPKTRHTMYDVVHLNAEGSRQVADIVTKALTASLRS